MADDNNGDELEIRPGSALAAQMSEYEELMLDVIGQMGLPSAGVLVNVEERRRLLTNLEDALTGLDTAGRGRALYLSKFVMAVGAGLFDAALNYLWDETIRELRRRVVIYDLNYFYDIAVTAPDRRKHLRSEEDLSKVDDSDLIRATNLMGLVSDVGYRQLDLVRYMRNFASAAHPNQNELTGLQLVGFLETCIKEVIALPESTAVAEVRKLLVNIKSSTMTDAEARATSAFFVDLQLSQADNLGQGLFGIFVDPATLVSSRDNVRLLWPLLWPSMSDDVKRGFGVRYARFLANGDQQQAAFGRELLDLVDASSFLPETVRVTDIDEALDALTAAHAGMNNFYTEPALARSLLAFVGKEPVPIAVRSKFVRTVVDVFLGRGSGTTWNADPVYRELISGFTPEEARLALLAFRDLSISSKLQMATPASQYRELLSLLQPKFSDRPSRDLLSAVSDFPGGFDKLRLDSAIGRLADAI